MNLSTQAQGQAAVQSGDWPQVVQILEFILDDPHPDWEMAQTLALAVLQAGDFEQRWRLESLWPRLGADFQVLLGVIGDESFPWEGRWFAVRMLATYPEAIPSLVTLLRSPLAEAAIFALGQVGSRAIPDLSACIHQPGYRRPVVEVLSQLHDPQVIEVLLPVSQDRDPGLRGLALKTLAQWVDRRVVEFLLPGLEHPDSQIRRAVVVGLGRHRDPALGAPLARALEDPDVEVAAAAALALGRLGSESAVKALAQRLTTAPLVVQVPIVRALAWLETPLALDYLRQALAWESLRPEIVSLLGRVHQVKPRARDILLDLLQETLPAALRQEIVTSLGLLGDRQAGSTLEALLQDPDLGVRMHAQAALRVLDIITTSPTEQSVIPSEV